MPIILLCVAEFMKILTRGYLNLTKTTTKKKATQKAMQFLDKFLTRLVLLLFFLMLFMVYGVGVTMFMLSYHCR